MGQRSRSWHVLVVALALAGCRDDAASVDDGADGGSTGAGTSTGTGTSDGTTEPGGSSDSSGGEPQPPEVDAAPAGIRRLRADQYVKTIAAVLGPPAGSAAVPPPDLPLQGFDSIGVATLPLSPAAVEQYERSAIAVGAAAAAAPESIAAVAPCVVDGPKDEGCYVAVAEQLGRVLWRRPIDAGELDGLVDIARLARSKNGDSFEVGLQYEVAAMLVAPAFLYAVELGEPRDDGKRWLTTDEWVTRAALFVLGRAPDASTFARIDAGELDGADAPRELAQQMVVHPDARSSVGRFFDELLRTRDVVTKSKDPELFPLFTPTVAASMRQETLRLVDEVVFDPDGDHDLLRLFDADHTFVDAALAPLYGLEVPSDGSFHRVDLPAGQGRMGVLTQPALLASASHHDRNSPTRRGLFVQRTLLCNDVPPPPGDVDTTLPEPTEPTTLRARMEGHIEQGGPCVGCHAQTDPVGFAFEFFDASGVRRDLDNGFPIDASGEVEDLGTFADAVGLAALVRDDPRLSPCLVRNLYRHAIGRVEDEGTADALAYLSANFEAGSHDLRALMIDLVANPAFQQVTEAQ